MNKICCIGHITLDKIITPQSETYMPGGTAYYFAHGMYHLNGGKNFGLITSVASTEMGPVDELRAKGVEVHVIPSRHTVFFENKYGENQNNRSQRVLAKADPFTVERLQSLTETDVPSMNPGSLLSTADPSAAAAIAPEGAAHLSPSLPLDAGIFHLGSLLADDFPPELIRCLHQRGVVSVDSQGYLREVRGEQVYPVDWENKLDVLPYIDVLKVNEHEMEVLTHQKEAHDAALQLAEWGVKEVCVTLGDYGSVILENNHFYDICAYPPQRLTDATGCGDTYSTGYLYLRSRGATPQEAGHFAAAMSTLKLQASGPFAGTEEDVWRMIR